LQLHHFNCVVVTIKKQEDESLAYFILKDSERADITPLGIMFKEG
jgi:hypothetical protein